MPRLVQVDEHKLEAYLDGTMMIFTHTDTPGIIGNIGTTLGKHQINIAQMAVGRNQPGGQATGVLNIDSEPSQAVLDEVKKIPGITGAIVIKLPPAGQLPTWLQG